MLNATTLNFLSELKENNNREWFGTNKSRYETEQAQVEVFADELLKGLNQHDVMETPSGKRSLYRIYRDVRFSKDKTPYQNYWGGGFKRAGQFRRGGYYYHLEKGRSSIVGGFWGPNAKDLKRIREEIAADASPLRAIITSTEFKINFEQLNGNQLKTAPQGFEKSHTAIDLLRYKQFLLIRKFTDEEVLSPNFAELANQTFKQMRPFFDYMSEILTTDSNGITLL